MTVQRRIKPTPRPPAPRSGSVEQGKAVVETALRVKKEERGTKHQEFTLLERRFGPDEHPAHVRVGVGMTISTGNFEFLRLDVSVSLPCLPNEIEDAYAQASASAADFLAEEQTRWMAAPKGR